MVCASSAPPVTGPATTVTCSAIAGRQHVDQVLRHAPDRRRIAEQLVRVQIEAAVVAVAVVEVPLHHHFEAPQVLHGAGCGCRRGARPSPHLRSAEATSAATRRCDRPRARRPASPRPRRGSVQPWYGVFFDLLTSAARSMVTGRSGARMVMSAAAPSVRLPPGTLRMRAGLTDISSTSRGSRITPAWTSRSSAMGMAVSRPTMPNGARSNSTFFSSAWCGAWSVAMTSTLPSAMPAQHRVAVAGLAQRRVHLGVGVVGHRRRQQLVGQREVMRRHLAGHLHAAALALAHRLERRPRAHVRDVDVAADHLGDEDVAAGGDRLGDAGDALQPERRRHRPFVRHALALERRVLAVLDERHAEHAGVLHRAARQQRGRDRMAVVADAPRSRRASARRCRRAARPAARARPRQSDRRGPGRRRPPS